MDQVDFAGFETTEFSLPVSGAIRQKGAVTEMCFSDKIQSWVHPEARNGQNKKASI